MGQLVIYVGRRIGAIVDLALYALKTDLVATKYHPTALTVEAGTLVSGTVADLATNAGITVRINETADGLRVRLDYEGVTDFNAITSRVRYAGGSGHVIQQQFWNWVTAQVEAVGEPFSDQTVLTWLSSGVPSASPYIGTGADAGKVRHYFNHPANGNANHYLLLDYAGLNSSVGGSVISVPTQTQAENTADVSGQPFIWSVLRLGQWLAKKLTTYIHPASQVSVDTSGFTGNLAATDTSVQLVADKVNALDYERAPSARQRLSDLTTTNGWVKTGSGSVAIDSTDSVFPPASTKFTLGAGQNVIYARTGALDLTRKSLVFAVKLADKTALSIFDVVLWQGAAYSKWTARYDLVKVSGEWEYICCHLADLDTSYGDIDFSAITKIEIKMTATSATTAWISNLFVEPNIYPALAVFTFDDANASDYTEAFARMMAKGWRGCCFLTTDLIDTAGKLTSAQVRTMDRCGWDMGGHSSDSNILTSLTRLQQIHRLSKSKGALERLGITRGGQFMTFPGTWYTSDIKQLARRYYRQFLLGGADTSNITPELEGIYRYSAGTNLTYFHAHIDRVKLHGGLFVPFYHELGGAGYSTTSFQATLDYIESIGMEVVTVSELYARRGMVSSGAPPSMSGHSGGYLYLYGDESTDGSSRIYATETATVRQQRTAGVWNTVATL